MSPHEPLGIPTSLKALRATTASMLPRLDLPDLLLEVNTWTGFLDEFTHVSESSTRMQHLDVSVAAVLIAQACNVGLVPVENENHEALTRKRLSHIEQSYLRADTLRAANSRLVDAQHNAGVLTSEVGRYPSTTSRKVGFPDRSSHSEWTRHSHQKPPA